MSSILFALVSASLCALVVHETTWFLRRRVLTSLSVIGILALTAYVFALSFAILWMCSMDGTYQATPTLTDVSIVLLIGTAIVAIVFFLGHLHKKQLSCGIWKSMLAMWAEAGLCVCVGFYVFHFLADQKLYAFLWPVAGFDYFEWEAWFERFLFICCLLLSVTRPLHEPIKRGILQIARDWFRLK